MNPLSAEQAVLDAHYMARALELARNGLYTTHPNPRVGCVIVRAGQIVGMAAAYQHQDRVITYSYAGAVGGYGVLGGLDCLKERLLRLTLSRG